MDKQTFTCPHCSQPIELNAALQDQIKHQIEAEPATEAKQRNAEFQTKLAQLDQQKQALAAEAKTFEQKVESELKARQAGLIKEAERQARQTMDLELSDLKNQNHEIKSRLETAQKSELDLRRQARELEEKQKNLDLEIQRRLDTELQSVASRVKAEADEEHRSRLAEKDKQMEMMRRAMEEAQRKAEQGSMQIQGEVQEEDLKKVLISNFPVDSISDVPTGIKGADLVHTVNSTFGRRSGVILWESKNTKLWGGDWAKKLRDDQGLVKADICVLVSRVLPPGITGFGQFEGIWVSDYQNVLALTSALRFHLLALNQIRNSLVGRDEKMEFLYNYLSGSQFQNRIENIVSAFTGMKQDLEAEKRAIQRSWSKRDKEIERVIFNTSGLYGDLQGIIGASLPPIESLELPETVDWQA